MAPNELICIFTCKLVHFFSSIVKVYIKQLISKNVSKIPVPFGIKSNTYHLGKCYFICFIFLYLFFGVISLFPPMYG